jgi:hypothetical protein
MPMLCELTTVLQYMVAMEESTALPPFIITFLEGGAGGRGGGEEEGAYLPILAQGMESTETAAYW